MKGALLTISPLSGSSLPALGREDRPAYWRLRPPSPGCYRIDPTPALRVLFSGSILGFISVVARIQMTIAAMPLTHTRQSRACPGYLPVVFVLLCPMFADRPTVG